MGQQIIVGLIITVCVLYVLRKFVFKPKTAKGSLCAGCDRCCGKNSCH